MSEYTHLGLSIALGRPETCHEEVARADDLEPCGKTAVALRVDPQEGEPYPVCARHARASMVPLVDIVRFMLDRHVDMPDDPMPAFKPIRVDPLPAGHALIGGVVTPLPVPFDPSPRA